MDNIANCLYIILLSTVLITKVNGQTTTLISVDFSSSSSCLTGLNGSWTSYDDGTPILNCSTNCYQTTSPATSVALLTDIRPSISGGLKYTYNIGSLTQYAVIGVDVLYFTSGDATLTIQIGQFAAKSFNPSSKTLYIDTASTTCGSTSEVLQKASFQINRGSSLVSGNNLVITFSKVTYQALNLSILGLKKISIWMNCSLNCSVCQDGLNCSVCTTGYSLIRLPSSGTIVCEQTSGCSSNCYSCAVGQTENICTACIPGYDLFSNTCILTPSYYVCSANCLVYNSSTQTFGSCPGVEVYSNYQCSQNQFVLIYPDKNYSTYQCGCDIANCGQCVYQGSCISCSSGYQLNASGQCVLRCSSTQYYDSNTYTCRNCGTNCISCNSSSCLKCTDSTYYISSSTPKSCLQCSILNCQQCSSNGYCSVCNSGYTLSANKLSCPANCSSANCSTCVSGSSTNCSVCNSTYTLNTNTQQCVQCLSGYIMLADFSCVSITSCVVSNCNTCVTNDPLHCSTCNSTYSLNSNFTQCLPCGVSNCQTCSPNNYLLCQTCVNSYYLTTDQSQCKTCGVSNCQICQSNNYQLCQTCQASYYISSNSSSCIPCQVSNCQSCGVNENTCSTCQNNYYLTADSSQCLPCSVSNCSQCDVYYNVCKSCNSNFYITTDKSQCLSCQVANCSQCDGIYSKCKTCNTNYYPNSDYSSCLPCGVQNCQQCSSSNYQVCQQCSTDFSLNSSLTQCKLCSVSNCKECLSTNYEQCSICNTDYELSSDGSLCLQTVIPENIQNDFQIDQTVTDSGYDIKLKFDKSLLESNLTSTQLLSIFSVSISDLTSDQYTITMQQISNQVITLQILPLINLKTSKINVTITNSTFQYLNLIATKTQNEDLSPYVKISSAQKQAAQEIANIGSGVTTSVITSIIPAALFGNFYIICNTLDITGYLYYLIFLNIRYPLNIVNFYTLFKDFSFPFIPNIFQYFYDPNYSQQSPPKFMAMNTDNYFLHNSGQYVTIYLAGFGLYLLGKIFAKSPIKYLNSYCERATRETWEYSGFIDLNWSFYIYLVVAVLVQFNTYNFDDKNSYLVNYIAHSIFSVIFLGIPFFFVYKIYKAPNFSEKEEFMKRYSSLVNGLKIPQSEEENRKQETNSSPNKQNQEPDIEQKDEAKDGADNQQYCKSSHTINDKNTETPPQAFDSMGEGVYREYYTQNGTQRRRRTRVSTVFSEIYENRLKQDSLSSLSNFQLKAPLTRQDLIIKLSKYYNVVLYFRKILFCLVVCFMYEYTYAQIALFCVLNIIIIVYIAYITPFKSNFENIQFLIQEVCMIAIQLGISLLVTDDPNQSEDERMLIGWIIVAISGSLIGWFTFFIFKDLLSPLISLFRKLISRFINRKQKTQVTPLTQATSPQQQIETDQNKINQNEEMDKKDDDFSLNYKKINSKDVFSPNYSFTANPQPTTQQIRRKRNSIRQPTFSTNFKSTNSLFQQQKLGSLDQVSENQLNSAKQSNINTQRKSKYYIESQHLINLQQIE